MTTAITCQHPNSPHVYRLKLEQVQLLVLVAYHGFLTYQQLNAYYLMLTNGKHQLSHLTLDRWSKKHYGILSKHVIQHHAVYNLTNLGKQCLIDNNYLDSDSITFRQINIHNIMLNQAITMGMYHTWLSLWQHNKKYHDDDVDNGFSLIAKIRGTLNQDEERLTRDVPDWLYGIDLRSYNRQLGISYEDNAQLILRPDAVINSGYVTTYIELDNLSESNFTLLNKISKYIEHAYHHPHNRMTLCLIINDGSVRNKQVFKPCLPTTKISNLIKGFLRHKMMFANKEITYSQAYNLVPNLNIYISPLSESWIDISDNVLGQKLPKQIQQSIKYWERCNQSKLSIKQQRLHVNNSNRYTTNSYAGNFVKRNTANYSPRFILINGQEHLIDTMITTYLRYQQAKVKRASYPLVIYPYRHEQINLDVVKELIMNAEHVLNYNCQRPALLQQNDCYDYHVANVKLIDNVLSDKQTSVPINTDW